MASKRRSEIQMQRNFMYLLERLGEPLGHELKGSSEDVTYYNMPRSGFKDQAPPKPAMASDMIGQSKHIVNVNLPSKVPMEEFKEMGNICPRNGLFGYFIPGHRKALAKLRKVFLEQPDIQELFNMASFCRDSQMIHPQLYVNALTSCLAKRKDTKNIVLPSFYEVMPELFFTDHVIEQAEKMARNPKSDRNIILVDQNATGHQNDSESRLWYFREDIGVNSHHFHWHVVFPGDYGDRNEMKRDRRGELFYYMHHAMIARYDAERLSNGLPRTKLFDFENLVLDEGYFGKLYSTNSGRHWGTRQANTKLQSLVEANDGGASGGFLWNLKIEDLKRWRDRIYDAIDTGTVIRKGENGNPDTKHKLTEKDGIDVLGDIIENSQDSPHLQFYGVFGFHNMGHLLIAFSHDPQGKHREFFGPMGDTTTAMRDPAFYRWHKYIDDMFDNYKQTLGPYELREGSWPLVWEGVEVTSVNVVNSNEKYKNSNTLSTHWIQSHVDLSRGLDFYRTRVQGSTVLARVTHLSHDHFKYIIKINNLNGPVNATVRIFLAPTNNEHGDHFQLIQQRLLFFELDKFFIKLKKGENVITRHSSESSVTLATENTFRQLEQLNRDKERDDFRENEDQSRCGCGWPQHLLLPRGTPSGAEYDLFVMVTDGSKDAVPLKSPRGSCRDAMSFCGIIDDLYPDARPMGYPFDRLPYNKPDSQPPTPIDSIEEYVENIANAKTIKIKIIHNPNETKIKEEDEPLIAGMNTINERGEDVEVSVPNKKHDKPDIRPNFNRPWPNRHREVWPQKQNGLWNSLGSNRVFRPRQIQLQNQNEQGSDSSFQKWTM